MRIAIVGAGVGGLSLARALNRLGVQNITVFDRRLSPLPQTDRGLGLWDDSQVNFFSHINKVLSNSWRLSIDLFNVHRAASER